MNYLLHNPCVYCGHDVLWLSEQGWTFDSLHVNLPSEMSVWDAQMQHTGLVRHCKSTCIMRATKRGNNE